MKFSLETIINYSAWLVRTLKRLIFTLFLTLIRLTKLLIRLAKTLHTHLCWRFRLAKSLDLFSICLSQFLNWLLFYWWQRDFVLLKNIDCTASVRWAIFSRERMRNRRFYFACLIIYNFRRVLLYSTFRLRFLSFQSISRFFLICALVK